jgi:hypothetical protein
MKLPSFYSWLLCLLVFKFSVALGATYNMTELVATPLEVPDIVNAVVWDNVPVTNENDKSLINIGFPFQFDETIYTELTIFTNGILKFGSHENMYLVDKNRG